MPVETDYDTGWREGYEAASGMQRAQARPMIRYLCENCDGSFWIDGREKVPTICPFCQNRNMLGAEDE
jgi:hypothetical protein